MFPFNAVAPRTTCTTTHLRLFLDARDHALDGLLEMGEEDRLGVVAGRDQRCLVAHVGDVSSGEAGRAHRHLACNVVLVEVGGQRTQVDAEDGGTALDVGQRHKDLAIEAAGPEKGWIEDVDAVGGSQNDNVLLRGEA